MSLFYNIIQYLGYVLSSLEQHEDLQIIGKKKFNVMTTSAHSYKNSKQALDVENTQIIKIVDDRSISPLKVINTPGNINPFTDKTEQNPSKKFINKSFLYRKNKDSISPDESLYSNDITLISGKSAHRNNGLLIGDVVISDSGVNDNTHENELHVNLFFNKDKSILCNKDSITDANGVRDERAALAGIANQLSLSRDSTLNKDYYRLLPQDTTDQGFYNINMSSFKLENDTDKQNIKTGYAVCNVNTLKNIEFADEEANILNLDTNVLISSKNTVTGQKTPNINDKFQSHKLENTQVYHSNTIITRIKNSNLQVYQNEYLQKDEFQSRHKKSFYINNNKRAQLLKQEPDNFKSLFQIIKSREFESVENTLLHHLKTKNTQGLIKESHLCQLSSHQQQHNFINTPETFGNNVEKYDMSSKDIKTQIDKSYNFRKSSNKNLAPYKSCKLNNVLHTPRMEISIKSDLSVTFKDIVLKKRESALIKSQNKSFN